MKSKINIDEIFSHIGELGKQQVKYCLLLSLLGMYNAQIMLQYTFVGRDSSFICRTKNGGVNGTTIDLQSKCFDGHTDQCDSIIFNTTSVSTINSEWNLVCERAWLSPLTMSAFMAGVMVGALVLGAVADAVGRKRTLTVTFMLLIITNGASAAVGDFALYTTIRFACGFFTSGVILANFVLLNELIGASKRGLVGVSTQAFFAIGIVVFAAMGSQIPHWRELTAFSTVMALPLLGISHLFLPESPRWLQNKGRLKEAVKVLKNIALNNNTKWNDNLFSVDEDDMDNLIEDQEEVVHVNKSGRDSLADLFRHGYLLRLTLIQVFTWFVNGVAYYGLTLAAGNSGGSSDVYTATALSGAVELPAYAISVIVLSYFGRTFNICASMVLGGGALLMIPVCSRVAPFLLTSLALAGKLCISASFAIIYIHSNEIFPTSIRNSGMGLVSVAARVGGILAPYFAKLGYIFPYLHFIIFGLLSLTAGLLVALLPDTKDMSLPETVQDLLSRRHTVGSPTKNVPTSPEVTYKRIPLSEE